MGFNATEAFDHQQPDRIGVLIANLGTPAAPTAEAVRHYLKQFLSDPRVVEQPRLLWWLILNGVILRTRPAKSAASYASVWTEQGSPLAVHTENQAVEIRVRLPQNIVVDWAMRYGEPSIPAKIQSMLDRGVRRLLILPLYPQYSATTTASTFDAVAKDFVARRWLPELRFVSGYHSHPMYIDALASSIRAQWQYSGQADKIIFSYHGIPLRYFHRGDPYHCQCHVTTRLVAEKLGLTEDQYLTTFQSRFGFEKWLRPYTDETMKSLPDSGVKSVQVICPGFASDCLETLEEIAVENRQYFIDAGGERFEYIPALNTQQNHINLLVDIIHNNIQGWDIYANKDYSAREARYQAHSYNQK